MRRPAPGSTRGVLTALLAVLLVLAGPVAASPAAAVDRTTQAGDGNALAGRHTEDDAVSGAPTRLTSSRSRTAPRAQVDTGGAAAVPQAGAPRLRPHSHQLPRSRVGTALPVSRGRTPSRAPPA